MSFGWEALSLILGINRFMTGQIWLGVLKLALFLAHTILFIVITSATLDAVANAATNEDLQNAIGLVGVNSFYSWHLWRCHNHLVVCRSFHNWQYCEKAKF